MTTLLEKSAPALTRKIILSVSPTKHDDKASQKVKIEASFANTSKCAVTNLEWILRKAAGEEITAMIELTPPLWDGLTLFKI